MSHCYVIKRVNTMADEAMDTLDDEELPDEKLDAAVDDESNDESADDQPAKPKTSEGEDDQSNGDESDDDDDQDNDKSEDDESDDESGQEKQPRTPEQIAKYERKRRKKAERELRELKGGGTPTKPSKDGPVLPPGSMAERFWNTVVTVDIQQIAASDPTVNKRAGMIKKIIFKEMPWLQNDPNGVRTANEIAIGRTVQVTPGTESDEPPVQRKTTPAKPRTGKTGDTFKRWTDAEYANHTEQEQIAYEDQLRAHLSGGGK
jgi:hypothetical protein